MDVILWRRRQRRNHRQRHNIRIERRILRDKSDPLIFLSDVEFKKLFRLSKQICRIFISMISPFIKGRKKIHGLTKEAKILCTLRFLATGSYQRPIGQDFLVAFSQTSVSRSIAEVCRAISTNLGPLYVQFPNDASTRNEIKQKFFAIHGFPGIIGLIDGTHIPILKPPNDVEYVYYSVRKSCHTKNVQIVCDPDYRIININARYGGSAHDSYVWNNSSIKMKLYNEFSDRNHSWLLGDSGYGQQPWLMTPYLTPENENQRRYNIAHKKTRRLVENCIGVLKSRFRCLSKQRILMYSPQKSGDIINSCAVLHNIMISVEYPLPTDDEIAQELDDDNSDDDDDDDDELSLANNDHYLENYRRLRLLANSRRNDVASQFF